MSTEEDGAAEPDRPAPDASAALAGDEAEAGGEVRPRGRRFRRPRGGGIAAGVPAAAALDAISLRGDDRRAAAPQAADAAVGSAGGGGDVSGEPGPGIAGTRTPGGINRKGPAGRGPGTPPPAPEVAGDPRPAWPLSRHRGRELDPDDQLPGSVISGSILPEAGGVAVAGPDPGIAAKPVPAGAGRPAGTGVDRRPAGVAGRHILGGEAGADAAAAPPLFVLDASHAVLAWARRRHLGPSSATGISVALASCAAAWFSAGTTANAARGVAALWCSYLVLTAGRLVAGQAANSETDRRVAGPVRWLAALGSGVAEAAVYAGLAIGAEVQRYPDMWALGVGVVGLVTVRNLMTACSTPYGLRQPPETVPGRICAAVVTMALGGRILVVGVVTPFWGARAALLVLLAWAISSVGYGLAGRAVPDVAAGSRSEDGSVLAPASLLRLRDDGMLARYLGALVRGSLLPLPPAVLGLAAVTGLALLGLHGLPGPLLIAPAFVMLLAAPGSANSHLGRFDWLVPALLLSSQVLYIGAVGAGGRVPGPIVFALAAALLVRYTDLACPQRPVLLVKPRRRGSAPREYGTALGWEGRLLFIGVTAAMGIAAAGYLALTAYLVLLMAAKAVRSCITSPDDDLA